MCLDIAFMTQPKGTETLFNIHTQEMEKNWLFDMQKNVEKKTWTSHRVTKKLPASNAGCWREEAKKNIAIVECLVNGWVLLIFYKCNQNETELTKLQYKYLFLFSWEKKNTESLLNFRYTFSWYSFSFSFFSGEHFFLHHIWMGF